MGVYIKGMEMPKSCDECRIMVFEDTNCAPELYCGCPIVFKAHPQGVSHRPDYCPLAPVPEHGRLIDADEFKLYLAKTLIKYAPAFKTDEYAHFAVQLTEAIASDIDEAPTVIEAEEGDT